VIGVETTTIKLTDLPDSRSSPLKSGNTDDISVNNTDGKQSGGEIWEA
jgi:hypothetical protein